MDRDTVVIDTYERIGMDIYDPSGDVDIDTALFLLEGQSYTMAATPGFASYLWQPATYLSDPALQAVTVTPAEPTWYTVFGTTDQGCVETDMVHVVIARPIEIFSGFSPNGDGINDTWVITNAVQYGDRIYVKVFNRWGEPVFESKGYGGTQEWDGTRNNRPMPVGAYYYIIELNDGKSEPYTGTVTILR
jgi:gliding motility-associated-like protein